jgi:Lrp/AsnC family transcriptional regulator for asnA, asnC and gidA
MARNPNDAIDILDLKILKHLSEDGRKSFQAIADDLGVTYSTIRSRFIRMCERYNLRTTTWLDPSYIGLNAFANIRISVTSARLDEVAAEISEFPEVNWLGRVIGEFDLNADVTCHDIDHLTHLIDEKINKIEGVTETRVALYSRIINATTLPNSRILSEVIRDRSET